VGLRYRRKENNNLFNICRGDVDRYVNQLKRQKVLNMRKKVTEVLSFIFPMILLLTFTNTSFWKA
jgi:hypothetical protein